MFFELHPQDVLTGVVDGRVVVGVEMRPFSVGGGELIKERDGGVERGGEEGASEETTGEKAFHSDRPI